MSEMSSKTCSASDWRRAYSESAIPEFGTERPSMRTTSGNDLPAIESDQSLGCWRSLARNSCIARHSSGILLLRSRSSSPASSVGFMLMIMMPVVGEFRIPPMVPANISWYSAVVSGRRSSTLLKTSWASSLTSETRIAMEASVACMRVWPSSAWQIFSGVSGALQSSLKISSVGAQGWIAKGASRLKRRISLCEIHELNWVCTMLRTVRMSSSCSAISWSLPTRRPAMRIWASKLRRICSETPNPIGFGSPPPPPPPSATAAAVASGVWAVLVMSRLSVVSMRWWKIGAKMELCTALMYPPCGLPSASARRSFMHHLTTSGSFVSAPRRVLANIFFTSSSTAMLFCGIWCMRSAISREKSMSPIGAASSWSQRAKPTEAKKVWSSGSSCSGTAAFLQLWMQPWISSRMSSLSSWKSSNGR
eukprot:comp22186_c0_seq1/m.52242 comp22186_c0_seq1/g.52242  ORF comp22186_c0_seq1/g.52242 comp22186_c0_seq1/m.52242 type:complete len:421 (+) comp22186_c0_seq1:1244-2506(+)